MVICRSRVKFKKRREKNWRYFFFLTLLNKRRAETKPLFIHFVRRRRTRVLCIIIKFGRKDVMIAQIFQSIFFDANFLLPNVFYSLIFQLVQRWQKQGRIFIVFMDAFKLSRHLHNSFRAFILFCNNFRRQKF